MSPEALQEEELLKTISRRYQAPSVNLYHIEIHRVNMSIIPAEAARKHRVLPLARTGTVLTLAMIDPTNVPAMDDIARITGYNIERVVASEHALMDAIDRYYGPPRSS